MPLAKEVKTKAIEDFHRHDKDTGSPEVPHYSTHRAFAKQQAGSILSPWIAQNGRSTPPIAHVLALKQLPELPNRNRTFVTPP
jgi:hypothetical protein